MFRLLDPTETLIPVPAAAFRLAAAITQRPDFEISHFSPSSFIEDGFFIFDSNDAHKSAI
jgi:hypothetical protein